MRSRSFPYSGLASVETRLSFGPVVNWRRIGKRTHASDSSPQKSSDKAISGVVRASFGAKKHDLSTVLSLGAYLRRIGSILRCLPDILGFCPPLLIRHIHSRLIFN